MGYLLMFAYGFGLGVIICAIDVPASVYSVPKDRWQCTASHREGPEHDQHDVCDSYSRKE